MSVSSRPERDSFSLSVGWYLALIALGFLLILGRLFQLQVVQNRQHLLSSLNYIIQTVETIPPRGDIFDRTGAALAHSRNTFALLYFVPDNITDYLPLQTDDTDTPGPAADRLNEVEILAETLELDYSELMVRLRRETKRVNGPQLVGFRPVTLIDELTTEQRLTLAEMQLEGMYIEQYAFKREYALGPAAAHLIGYTGFIHENDPETIRNMGYGPRDPVGKEGIERVYESMLHGKPGKRDIEITSSRMVNRSGDWIAREVPPARGTDLYLTIDAQLQEKAHEVLANRPGAVIVCSLVPGHQGKILALASGPSFNPEYFERDGYFSSLLVNSDDSPNETRPLLNRTYRNAFPPGSTFKMVTATAALQNGEYTQGSTFNCRGYIELGKNNKRFHCHKRTGHGRLTLLEGISESCDVVFYQVALGLEGQQETIHDYGEYFGFGSPVGIELPNESAGILPNAEWKREHYSADRWNEVDRLWFHGDTATYGIGQSFLTATPLQVLWSSVIVALDGMRPRPVLLKAWEELDELSHADSPELLQLPLDPEVLAIVKSGMRLAVTTGTCEMLDIPGLNVCAKSGTAETGIPGEENHSWVTGFYPQHNPEVAFVVFFQNGGGAGEAAVPGAREILQFIKYRFDGSPIS